MRNIEIPDNVQDYTAQIHEQALPDQELTGNDFYRRLVGWVLNKRTPLLYEQDHPDEYTNLSINFNWLLERDYSQTKLGPPDTVKTMYTLHEMTHMTQSLPTRLDDISALQYAELFTRSEYRASNETELLIHWRVPGLRSKVFPDTKIAFDILKERNVPKLPMSLLCKLRPVIIEQDSLDFLFQDSAENQAILSRFKSYNNNRQWAIDRFKVIMPYFCGPQFPHSEGLSDDEYEAVISSYEPHLSQEVYESNIVRNVRLGYAMCGLAVPKIITFSDAKLAAKELEGQHAIVQS
jgi:hypothetical protein